MVAVQLEESGNRQMPGYKISGTDYSPHALGHLQLRAPVSTCIKLENEIIDCLSTELTRTHECMDIRKPHRSKYHLGSMLVKLFSYNIF